MRIVVPAAQPRPEQPLRDRERSRGPRIGFLSPHLAHRARPLRKSVEHRFLLGILSVTSCPVNLSRGLDSYGPSLSTRVYCYDPCCLDLSLPRCCFFFSLCHTLSVNRSCSVSRAPAAHTQGPVLLQMWETEQRWTCEHKAGAQLWPDAGVFPEDVPALDTCGVSLPCWGARSLSRD